MSSSVRVGGVDPDVERSCRRKRSYATKRDAKREAKSLGHARFGGDVTIYPCPYCGGWHVAHRRRPPR